MRLGQPKSTATTHPKVSIIIPTYNEAEIIRFKLANTSRLSYPKDLMEIIVVDSNSNDGTTQIVKDFTQQNPDLNITLIAEQERKGKSHALNTALAQTAPAKSSSSPTRTASGPKTSSSKHSPTLPTQM